MGESIRAVEYLLTYVHWGMYVEARQVHVQGRRNLAPEAQGVVILG